MPIVFKDPNFKLSCLDAIFNLGFHSKELEHVLAINPDFDEYEINEERYQYLSSLPINQETLDKITEFAPCGGDDIYFHVMPYWSGEEEELHIDNYADLQHLRNLEELYIHSVSSSNSLDLNCLLELKQLKKVSVDQYYVISETIDGAVMALENKGVIVEID